MILLQASKETNAPPKPCTPLDPFPLHERCHDTCIPMWHILMEKHGGEFGSPPTQ
jgi:hypothetical protein